MIKLKKKPKKKPEFNPPQTDIKEYKKENMQDQLENFTKNSQMGRSNEITKWRYNTKFEFRSSKIQFLPTSSDSGLKLNF